MKWIWRQRWFILASSVAVFFGLTATKVMAASTDIQLQIILQKGLDAFIAYLAWLVDILGLIW